MIAPSGFICDNCMRSTSGCCNFHNIKLIHTTEFFPSPVADDDTIPYVCPVCQGRGLVKAGFYDLNEYSNTIRTGIENCRACYATGVLWR